MPTLYLLHNVPYSNFVNLNYTLRPNPDVQVVVMAEHLFSESKTEDAVVFQEHF
jgi:hypothetical protein